MRQLFKLYLSSNRSIVYHTSNHLVQVIASAANSKTGTFSIGYDALDRIEITVNALNDATGYDLPATGRRRTTRRATPSSTASIIGGCGGPASIRSATGPNIPMIRRMS